MPFRHVSASLARVVATTVGLTIFAAGTLGASQAPTPVPPTRPNVVRIVRLKLSAADLASAMAWTEDYKRDFGVDPVWLDARAWVARGAWMLGQYDTALAVAHEVRAAIPRPTPDVLIPLGATYEVEGRIIAQRDGAAAGARFFREAAKLSPDAAFRSRMWKNVNRLELIGRQAPELAVDEYVGARPTTLAALRGRPVLLFFFNAKCFDCTAMAPTLASIRERFASRGLAIVAPTRLYGPGRDGTPATPEDEKALIAATLRERYAGLPDLPAPVDTETAVRYGASSTPTFVLVDREGVVRLYEPTRLTFDALAEAIEPLLAQPSKAS